VVGICSVIPGVDFDDTKNPSITMQECLSQEPAAFVSVSMFKRTHTSDNPRVGRLVLQEVVQLVFVLDKMREETFRREAVTHWAL
jgi:hypothetical protein